MSSAERLESELSNFQIHLQAVNFGDSSVNLKVLVTGLDPNVMKVSGSTRTVLTSTNVMDENSFTQPEKVSQETSTALSVFSSITAFNLI